MASQATNMWQIGKWRVEPALGRVSSESGEEFLRPREMDLLVYLATQQGQIVTADDIVTDVWSGVEVTNDSLYFSVSQLRKRLDEPDAECSIIETIPKRGYRLTVTADRLSDVDITTATSDEESSQPETVAGLKLRSSGRGVLHGAIAVIVGVVAVGWFRVESPGPAQPILPSPANTIAVMPLIDLSPDTDYTYFSDGITDEILNRLARVQGLQVAARTSSFAFKNSEASVTEIGSALGVGTLLEGSVRKDGDRVRISVQLISADTGFQLWSDTYERELSNVFAIQNEISHEIADALQLTLTSDEQVSNSTDDTYEADPRAVEEYLLGLEALRTHSFDSIRQSIRHFENVLQIDPSFTQALLQLADAKLGLLNTGASYDMSLIDEAQSLVEQALARNPDDGSAHRIMGTVSRWRGQWEDSLEQVQRALELSPSDAVAMVHLGEIYMIHGDLAAADQAFERALRFDPYGSAAMMRYAGLKHRIGDVDSATATIRRAIELHPTNPNLPWVLGKIHVVDFGDLATGLEYFLLSAQLDPQDYEIAAYVAMTYLSLGMQDAAAPWIERAKSDGPDTATSQAVEATYLQVTGQESQATSVSTTAIRDRDYRLHFHEILSNNLVAIALRNLLDDGRADSAVQLLEGALPHSETVLGMQRNAEVEGSVATMHKYSGPWQVALAFAHEERGDSEIAATLIEKIQRIPNSDSSAGSIALRCVDYLLEARVLVMQGDDDAALDMLEKAVQHNLVFAWQIQVVGDYAFRHLESNPRFIAIVEQIQDRVERQRNIVLARESSAKSALVN